MIKRFSKAIAALAVAALLVAELSPLATTVYAAEEETDSDDAVVTEEVVEDDDIGEEDTEFSELLASSAELSNATVSYKTLGQVTGLKYNTSTGYLTWNKVTNADYYIISMSKEIWNKDSGAYDDLVANADAYAKTSDLYYYFPAEDIGKYTIQVRAVSEKYYIVAKNISYDKMVSKYTTDSTLTSKIYYEGYGIIYNGTKLLYTLYIIPGGDKSSAITVWGGSYSPTSSEEKSISTTTVSEAPTISLKETKTATYDDGYTDTTYIFGTTSSPVNLTNYGEYLIWEVSNNSSFAYDEDGTTGYWYESNYDESADESDGEISLSASYGNLGDTYYIRCSVYNPFSDKYSAYSNVVSVKAPSFQINSTTVYSKATSIAVKANANYEATGYQFQKKVGKTWVTMAKQSSATYKFTKLTKNKKYSLRVRAYNKNEITGKTTYTSWYTVDALTWAGNLNVQTSATSSKSVKVSWKKISGAEGYEIYRSTATSSSSTTKNGISTSDCIAYTLVKKVSKKKKSYTDKNLTAGASYTYIVRAYRKIGGKKVYIQDSDSLVLKAQTMDITAEYYNSKGQYVVKWNKITGISGYVVEKYNRSTGKWVTYKKLKKSSTSVTLPKASKSVDYVEYRIRPYKGKTYYDAQSFTVYPQLAIVKNVKATATSSGIKITWSKVSGADYYQVYRTTDSHFTYDATTKSYTPSGTTTLVYDTYIDRTGFTATGSNPYYYLTSYRNSKIKGKSCLDTRAEYTKYYTNEDGYDVSKTCAYNTSGAEEGVTYYYYVVAYTSYTYTYYDYDEGKTVYTTPIISSIGYSKPASARYTSVKAASAVNSASISAKSSSKGKVTVKVISKMDSGVKGYAIYRATKKNGSYALVGITTSSSFTDASATSGKTYYYKVAAIKESEAGEYIYGTKSAAKSVKVK